MAEQEIWKNKWKKTVTMTSKPLLICFSSWKHLHYFIGSIFMDFLKHIAPIPRGRNRPHLARAPMASVMRVRTPPRSRRPMEIPCRW